MGWDDPFDRLSRITTQWSIIIDAHAPISDQDLSARSTLLQRYGKAVYRYLLGAARDPDAAEELSQEFALRLVRGDFRRVDPQHGRFRNYVKSVLINLVNDHFRSLGRRPGQLQEEVLELADAVPQPEFEVCLREEVLARTWSLLEQSQPRYHAVLQLRVKESGLSSPEMAERLANSTGTPWTPDTLRKTLERARTRFADLLLDEVDSTMECIHIDDLQATLEELDLLRFCRSALRRRAEGSGRDNAAPSS